MAANKATTSEKHATLDERLSFLSKQQRDELFDVFTKGVMEQARVTNVEVLDSKALQMYRERHQDLSKNARKAKNIRKTTEYKDIYNELFKEWEKEHPVPINTPETFEELLTLIEETHIRLGWGSEAALLVGKLAAEYFENAGCPFDENDCVEQVKDVLLSEDIAPYLFIESDYNYRYIGQRRLYHDIETVADLYSFAEPGPYGSIGWIEQLVVHVIGDPIELEGEVIDAFFSEGEGAVFSELLELADTSVVEFNEIIDTASDIAFPMWDSVVATFDEGTILDLLAKNPHYAPWFENEKKITAAILDRIPENPIDAYPNARAIKRKFVLHVGPTNSGKTHDAIDALGKAESGVYLGPLRLLAFEQYEKLNSLGCACTLRTGEEERREVGALHFASTIEMLDFDKHYAVAVIDEAQMMNDPDRGHRWTQAILGVVADEVHVCMAPEALSLVKELVGLCGDAFEVVEHKRFCPLEAQTSSFAFPKDVQQGDAIIVFSRRAVHAVAAELSKKRNMKVSMIYGALPYDVRHSEAAKFNSGKTQVVVATDAIGMGMNLPVKRIVFLELAKFDGVEKRFLKSTEIKQIAGRAGRYGIHEKGFYISAHENKKVRRLYTQKDPSITIAPLGFSPALLGVDGKISAVMTRWAGIEVNDPFSKMTMKHEIDLAKILEDIAGKRADHDDVKRLVYRFATIPFKDNLEDLMASWKAMFRSELSGKPHPIKIEDNSNLPKTLQGLEDEYAKMDLFYQYCRTFGYEEHCDPIMERRDAISAKMIEMLGRGGVFDAKKCRECGRVLPWNWPYPMCDKCHDRLYPRRYDDWDYW